MESRLKIMIMNVENSSCGFDLTTGVDTVGIYAENHDNECPEFFIWIRFDNRKLGRKGSLPLLLQDSLILKLCHLEESASHNSGSRGSLERRQEDPRFPRDAPHTWRRVRRTIMHATRQQNPPTISSTFKPHVDLP